MRGWLFLFIVLIAGGCQQSHENDAKGNGVANVELLENDKLFLGRVASCAYPSNDHYSNHKGPAINISSRNGRWFARENPEISQHTIELYDTNQKKKYLIYHSYYQIELTDINFSVNSNYLSFVGTPWGLGGVSEMYTLNLTNFEQAQFGETRGSYRFPQVVSDAGDILFYQARGGPAIGEKLLIQLAASDRITFWLGYRDQSGRISYLLKYTGVQTNFGPFDDENKNLTDSYTPFEEFALFPGLPAGEKANEYFAFYGLRFTELVSGKTTLNSLDDILRFTVRIVNSSVYAYKREAVNRLETLYKLRPLGADYEIPEELTTYPEQAICFDTTRFQ